MTLATADILPTHYYFFEVVVEIKECGDNDALTAPLGSKPLGRLVLHNRLV
jgi:hypothetical protein